MRYITIGIILFALLLCVVSCAQEAQPRKERIAIIKLKYTNAAFISMLFGGNATSVNQGFNQGNNQSSNRRQQSSGRGSTNGRNR